jgi:hypothetical protein
VSGSRLGVKTRRCGALTRAEAAKRGRAATGRGAFGHGKLQTQPVGTVARRAATVGFGHGSGGGADTGDGAVETTLSIGAFMAWARVRGSTAMTCGAT